MSANPNDIGGTGHGASLPDTAVMSATGLLAQCNEAGLLEAADLHPVITAARLVGESDEVVLVLAAAALQATRAGSICLDVSAPPPKLRDLIGFADPNNPDGPSSTDLVAALRASPLVSDGPEAPANQRPFRLDGTLLYAERFWLDQEAVRTALLTRRAAPPPTVDDAALTAALAANCDTSDSRDAVDNAIRSWVSVIAGGPGTGKTTTIGRLLQVVSQLADHEIAVALAAPTGKAAGRMQAVSGGNIPGNLAVTTGTLHRLLGSRGLGHGFRHGPTNPLPYDLVVVDELSLVSLPLMAMLLSALDPATRLVLVGDPDQLASVEAGAVLADIVDANLTATDNSTRAMVTYLNRSWRYGDGIAELATAVKGGDADRVLALLRSAIPGIEYLEADAAASDTDLTPLFHAVTAQTKTMWEAASAGDAVAALAALDQHRLLTAHREGRYGASRWQHRLETHLTTAIPGYGGSGQWRLAAPVLVTGNGPDLGVYNGDQGVVIATAAGLRVAFDIGSGILELPPAALPQAQSAQALTIHKSQGSQFDEVSVVLPEDSRLLSRQLLYTAITRAKRGVRLIGTETALRQAVATPALRASGLANRLRA
ncbi:MAG: exodeoxyribonuclease V subunit alpha [Propionibacteriaceae bacterium]|jgi:exodeoxyribonuclease V alpha subunit|nr:exodeoxyribonuclease V subunit alpha [Propionibacteriaceae bacterium]